MLQRLQGDGYEVEWDSEGEGYARLRVKAAATPLAEAAEDWLPEKDWYRWEFTGPDAFEQALQAALDELWPDRSPYRIP